MYVKCLECQKNIKSPGFKNHIKGVHKITFLEYLEKYKLDVYFKNTDIKIPSYYCQNCKHPLDEFIVGKDGKWILGKVKKCCLSTKNIKNLHICVFGNLNNYNSDYLKGRFTKEGGVKKYGEEIGLKKRQEGIEKCKGSKENFIKRHGEEEGLKKGNEFKNKSVQSKENFIKRHGEEEGLKKGNEYIIKIMENSPRLITYGLKMGYDYDEAILKKSEFNGQGSRLDFYIKKFGKKDGLKKGNEVNKKKSHGLGLPGCRSISSQECFDYIIKTLNFNKNDIKFEKFRENRTKKYLDSTFFLMDFYHKKLNLGIEFYGDFGHAKNYNANEKLNLPSGIKTAGEIGEYDKNRINQILHDNPSLNKPLIIGEYDGNNNPEIVIEKVVDKIKGD